MRSEKDKQGDRKGCAVISGIIIAIMCITLIIVFVTEKAKENKPSTNNSSNSSTIIENNTPQLFTRDANNNDINFNVYKESILEIQYTIIPKVDIKNLQLTIKIKDENNNILNTQIKNIGNVIKGNQYFFTISLSELSLTGYFNADSFSISTTGGTVSYFA